MTTTRIPQHGGMRNYPTWATLQVLTGTAETAALVRGKVQRSMDNWRAQPVPVQHRTPTGSDEFWENRGLMHASQYLAAWTTGSIASLNVGEGLGGLLLQWALNHVDWLQIVRVLEAADTPPGAAQGLSGPADAS